jgi:cell division protein ZapE
VSQEPRNGQAKQLADITPHVSADRLLADFVPPRHFQDARFDTYRANPQYPSQEVTRERLRTAAQQIAGSKGWLTKFLQNSKKAPAIYMDGGFGVGKTHLLASLAHEVGTARTAYGTFVEYTNLVGALGFAKTVEALSEKALVCIDEFELDDPGDTVLMSRLLRELADRGVALAATSNTLPDSLGEGRFAAEDFLREIQALAARFEVLRVDGEDYRRRSVPKVMPGLPDAEIESLAIGINAEGITTVDSFDSVLQHLSLVHPSRYGAMLDGIGLVGLSDVHGLTDQSAGLRFVVLVDRLYDRDVPVLLGGSGLEELFSETMLNGGYRKKYFRALSRLGALAQEGRKLVGQEIH